MKLKLEMPIVIRRRRVRINGPKGYREIDVVLDTGAVYAIII